MLYLKWFFYFIPASLTTMFCWFTNPIACLFPVKQKNGRERLWGIFDLWNTYDNPVDEFYFGHYASGMVDLKTYEASKLWRYWYRLRWLSRNTGYGWSYLLFSVPNGKGFQLKGQHDLFFGYYNDYNIGWKAHNGFDRSDYAARILGLRRK